MSHLRRNRRRHALVSLVAGLSILTLGACTTVGEEPAPTTGVEGDIIELSGANPDALGGDLVIPIGLDLALSGSGAYYGEVMANAARLAAAQIKAAGGPEFQLVIKDHKSGDPQAGVQTTREFGQEGVKMALYSYIGVLGSALQGIEEYQILSLDGGGGTQEFAKKMPYFYGTRALTPNDTYGGTAQYIAAEFPDVDSVTLVIGDTGAENVADSVAKAEAVFDDYDIAVGAVEVVPYGGTDFASAISKIVASDTDMVLSVQFGTDTGYFLKQLREAGSDLQVIGVDFIPDVVDIAGAAADGYIMSLDYFDAENTTNDWAQYMVDTAAEAYPDAAAPDYYFANYYQDMFTLWQVVQRVVAEGGDVNDSETLLAAFESDLTFPSVYGGNPGDPHGTQTIDAVSHSLAERQMYINVYDNGTVTRVATYGVGGVDFALVD
jgi:branched-chain amino acid transport system substrate-binding protein